jgi:hypothetical protein
MNTADAFGLLIGLVAGFLLGREKPEGPAADHSQADDDFYGFSEDGKGGR